MSLLVISLLLVENTKSDKPMITVIRKWRHLRNDITVIWSDHHFSNWRTNGKRQCPITFSLVHCVHIFNLQLVVFRIVFVVSISLWLWLRPQKKSPPTCFSHTKNAMCSIDFATFFLGLKRISLSRGGFFWRNSMHIKWSVNVPHKTLEDFFHLTSSLVSIW